MAKYELTIYDDNNEVVKTGETDIVKFSTLIKVMELNEKLSEMTYLEQLKEITSVVASAFPNLSVEDVQNADKDDVYNTFQQINRISNGINKGSKNA